MFDTIMDDAELLYALSLFSISISVVNYVIKQRSMKIVLKMLEAYYDRLRDLAKRLVAVIFNEYFLQIDSTF